MSQAIPVLHAYIGDEKFSEATELHRALAESLTLFRESLPPMVQIVVSVGAQWSTDEQVVKLGTKVEEFLQAFAVNDEQFSAEARHAGEGVVEIQLG